MFTHSLKYYLVCEQGGNFSRRVVRIDRVITGVYRRRMNTTLQVRIDAQIKRKAQKAFKASGIDLSSGVRLLLTHIGRTGHVPQEIFTYDNAPASFMKQLMREADYALKHGKVYTDVRAMHREILNDR